MSTPLDRMHDGLTASRFPAQVLADLDELGLVDDLPADLDRKVRRMLAAPLPLMRDNFSRHPGLNKPYQSASDLVDRIAEVEQLPSPEPVIDTGDPDQLRSWVWAALRFLGVPSLQSTPPRRACRRQFVDKRFDFGDGIEQTWRVASPAPPSRSVRHGHADFRGRMSADERRATFPRISKRQYTAAVRAVLHLEERTATLADRRAFEANVEFGKSRLASSINRDEFVRHPATAGFIAFYVARLGLRTQFSAFSQERPMDELASLLLERALPEHRLDLLSRVVTHQRILAQLDFAELEDLRLLYEDRMDTASLELERLFDTNRDRREMVMRRGDDSSQWNAASRAFNQARTGLLNLAAVHDPVREDLDFSLPGKVPALVASDVAHYLYSGELHQDLQVWDDLPDPWDTWMNGLPSSRDDVAEVCRRHGLDPETSGWTSAYRQASLEETTQTPDLVHGVAVSADPELVESMRKAGVFSGQP